MGTSVCTIPNGKAVTAEVEPRALLVQFLRETLRLTSTSVGCDAVQCDACAVHPSGYAVMSRNLLAVQALGAEAVTIEGANIGNGNLHPIRTAFQDRHAP